jgi:hypothetical protein
MVTELIDKKAIICALKREEYSECTHSFNAVFALERIRKQVEKGEFDAKPDQMPFLDLEERLAFERTTIANIKKQIETPRCKLCVICGEPIPLGKEYQITQSDGKVLYYHQGPCFEIGILKKRMDERP